MERKMACDGEGMTLAACADGQGTVCLTNNNSSPIGYCRCLDEGQTDAGDFWISTNCRVNLHTLNVLWIIHCAIWSLCCILSMIAIVIMRRKDLEAYRFDLGTAVLVFFASVFGIALALLEIFGAKRIGIDLDATCTFGLHHFFALLMLTTKPMAKSEYSISRFVMQRSPFTMKNYAKIFPLLVSIICIAQVFPIASAVVHALQWPMMVAFLVSDILALTIVVLAAVFATREATKQFNRTLSSPPILSKRQSVSLRVRHFFKNTRRVMYLATLAVILLDIALLTFLVCNECAQSLWSFVPVCFSGCGIWFCRNMYVSSSLSWRLRTSADDEKQQQQKQQGFSSKEQTVLVSPEGTGGGIDFKNSPNLLKQSKRMIANRRLRNKKKIAKRLELMSIVQEADYEGTVVITRAGGPGLPAHDEDTSTEEVAVGSLLGAHPNAG